MGPVLHPGDANGIELVRMMRRRSICGDVPVIVVTGDRMRETLRDAMRADVQGYVLKPYEPHVLAEKVGAALKKSKAGLPQAVTTT